MDRFAISKSKKSLKQRLDFTFEEKIETMDSLAKIEEEKSFIQRSEFLFQENIKTMDRLAITQEGKIIETTFRFSISRKD